MLASRSGKFRPMTRKPEPTQYVGPRRRATRRIPIGVLVVLGALALLTAALYTYAQPPPPARSSPASAAPPKDGWPTNGGNWVNQRHSPLTTIKRDNVAQL